MKRQLLKTGLLVTLLLYPALASSFTTRELSNVAWIANFFTNATVNQASNSMPTSPIIDSHGLTAQYVDDTHIRINGIQGCLDFVFTLSNSAGTPVTDGEYLTISSSTRAVNISASEYASQDWFILAMKYTGMEKVNNIMCGVIGGYGVKVDAVQFSQNGTLFKLHITKSGDGYKMESLTPLYVKGSADNNYWEYFIRYYDKLELTSFVPNALMTDRFIEYYKCDYYYDYYGFPTGIYNISPDTPERLREYPVRVEMDYTNNRFTVLNFGNNGYGICQNKNYYDNLYNDSKTPLPSEETYPIAGTFDPATKKLTFNPNQFAKPHFVYKVTRYGYFTPYVRPGMFNYQLERLDLEGNTAVDELFGTYDDSKKGLVHHNDAENGWVSHGGKRRTLEDIDMSVETYTYYLNQFVYLEPNFQGGYYDTRISCGDVTLQTEFVRNPGSLSAPQFMSAESADADPLAHVTYTQFTAGNDVGSQYYDGTKEWGIVPVINVIRNEKYVDSYEVMAVPGEYHTADDIHKHINEAVSFRRVFLNDGKTLKQVEGQPVFSASSDKNGLYKPGDFRIARKANVETYTFFIKANYKPEQLTPTYHDIYPYTFAEGLPTIVDTVEGTNVQVTGMHGAVEVTGDAAHVQVFTMTGMNVYSGAAGRIELPAGSYLVNVSGRTFKVMVL